MAAMWLAMREPSALAWSGRRWLCSGPVRSLPKAVESRARQLMARHDEISAMFGGGETFSPQQYGELSVEMGKLSPLVTQLSDLDSKREEAAELSSLLADGSAESELKDMASEELEELSHAMAVLEEDILMMAMPKVSLHVSS